MSGLNKLLEYYIALGWKCLQMTSTLAYCDISKLRRKCSVVNTVPVAVFTSLHFLHNLQMGAMSRVLHYTWLKRLARDKHSSLLGPFVSYEETEVL
jgi:hypothetical protein